MKYKVDEWVFYCRFPDSQFGDLKDERIKAVILEVLNTADIYDYRMYVDNAAPTYLKVKEKNIFPFNKPN